MMDETIATILCYYCTKESACYNIIIVFLACSILGEKSYSTTVLLYFLNPTQELSSRVFLAVGEFTVQIRSVITQRHI